MSEPNLPEDALANASREEILSAMFANLIFQHTNMTLLMLGRMSHPESGENFKDLEAAKVLIDQLEAIEFKTKGNLSFEEASFLSNNLNMLREALIEDIEAQLTGPKE